MNLYYFSIFIYNFSVSTDSFAQIDLFFNFNLHNPKRFSFSQNLKIFHKKDFNYYSHKFCYLIDLINNHLSS